MRHLSISYDATGSVARIKFIHYKGARRQVQGEYFSIESGNIFSALLISIGITSLCVCVLDKMIDFNYVIWFRMFCFYSYHSYFHHARPLFIQRTESLLPLHVIIAAYGSLEKTDFITSLYSLPVVGRIVGYYFHGVIVAVVASPLPSIQLSLADIFYEYNHFVAYPDQLHHTPYTREHHK